MTYYEISVCYPYNLFNKTEMIKRMSNRRSAIWFASLEKTNNHRKVIVTCHTIENGEHAIEKIDY